jgi:hypothetical protein
MSVGDLMHPAESADPIAQIAILVESHSAWYAAHLLLFVGMLVFVPGLLAITELATERRLRAGHAAQLLMLVSVGALSSVFTFEMLLGRMIAEGGDPATAVALLETFQSAAVFLAILPGLLAFFVGTACLVVSLSARADPFRWPALAFAVGAALILGEIILAEVLLSQVGNLVILMASTSFAVLLLRRDVEAPR